MVMRHGGDKQSPWPESLPPLSTSLPPDASLGDVLPVSKAAHSYSRVGSDNKPVVSAHAAKAAVQALAGQHKKAAHGQGPVKSHAESNAPPTKGEDAQDR